jgi:catechol 2,3-dioxygenase-like lactoylglutathione lyase family enzyme
MDTVPHASAWRLSRVHHIGITVADIERSVRFYRDVLGLTLLRRRSAGAAYIGEQTGYPGARLEVASFTTHPESGITLEIAQYVTHPGPGLEPGTNRPGAAHLCFQVENIHAAYDALRRQGVTFKSAPVAISSGPNEGGFGVYISDPDSFTIELFQPPSPVREVPGQMALMT